MSACAADFGDTAQALREAPQDVTESAASDVALVDVARVARSRMSSSASGIVPAIASPEPRTPNGWARRRRWAKDPVPWSRAEDGVIQHIVVKLVDGAGVRVVGGAIQRSSETPSEDDRERMQYLGCSAEAVGAHAERLSTLLADRTSLSLRTVGEFDPAIVANIRAAERRLRVELPDVTTFFTIDLTRPTRERSELLLRQLRESPLVEFAYAQPRPAEPPHVPCADQAPVTSSMSSWYQGPRARAATITPNVPVAPNFLPPGWPSATNSGHDVAYAWTVPGGRGAGAHVYDVEYAFDWDHEDLPDIPTIGGWVGPLYHRHGTAALGVIRACNQASPFGMVGIAHEAGVTFASQHPWGVAYAISAALSDPVTAKKVILLEAQFERSDSVGCHSILPPNSFYSCSCTFVPVETVPLEFSWIQYATHVAEAVVVEAAGNGGRLLDTLGIVAQPAFSAMNSGAIMVGSATSGVDAGGQHWPSCDSNTGSRIDVSAWGDAVHTLGHVGELAANGSGDVNQYYTASFGGTSGASAITAGSVASIAGMSEAVRRPEDVFRGYDFAELLKRTGVPAVAASAPRITGPTVHLGMAATVFSSRLIDDDSRTFSSSVRGARTGRIVHAVAAVPRDFLIAAHWRYNRLEGGAWDGWTQLPSPPTVSRIVDVRPLDNHFAGRLDLWARSEDGEVVWSQRSSLGASGTFAPWVVGDNRTDAIALAPIAAFAGYVEVFVTTSGGALRWLYRNASGGGVYEMPVSLSSPVTLSSRVLPVLTTSGRVVLIARDSMARVVSAVIDPATLSVSGWTVLATSTTDAFDAVAQEDGVIVAAVRASDRAYVHLSVDGGVVSSVTEPNTLVGAISAIKLVSFPTDALNSGLIRSVERLSATNELRSRTLRRGSTWLLGNSAFASWGTSTIQAIETVDAGSARPLAFVTRSDGRAALRTIDPVFPVR